MSSHTNLTESCQWRQQRNMIKSRHWQERNTSTTGLPIPDVLTLTGLISVSYHYVTESYYKYYCLCTCAAGVDDGMSLSSLWRVSRFVSCICILYTGWIIFYKTEPLAGTCRNIGKTNLWSVRLQAWLPCGMLMLSCLLYIITSCTSAKAALRLRTHDGYIGRKSWKILTASNWFSSVGLTASVTQLVLFTDWYCERVNHIRYGSPSGQNPQQEGSQDTRH